MCSILCISREGQIVHFKRGQRMALFPSDSGTIVQNYTCHHDVTRHLWMNPKPSKMLESGLQHPNGHLHPGSCPTVSYVVSLLWARPRVRVKAEQMVLAGVPSVSQQVAIILMIQESVQYFSCNQIKLHIDHRI